MVRGREVAWRADRARSRLGAGCGAERSGMKCTTVCTSLERGAFPPKYCAGGVPWEGRRGAGSGEPGAGADASERNAEAARGCGKSFGELRAGCALLRVGSRHFRNEAWAAHPARIRVRPEIPRGEGRWALRGAMSDSVRGWPESGAVWRPRVRIRRGCGGGMSARRARRPSECLGRPRRGQAT